MALVRSKLFYICYHIRINISQVPTDSAGRLFQFFSCMAVAAIVCLCYPLFLFLLLFLFIFHFAFFLYSLFKNIFCSPLYWLWVYRVFWFSNVIFVKHPNETKKKHTQKLYSLQNICKYFGFFLEDTDFFLTVCLLFGKNILVFDATVFRFFLQNCCCFVAFMPYYLFLIRQMEMIPICAKIHSRFAIYNDRATMANEIWATAVADLRLLLAAVKRCEIFL